MARTIGAKGKNPRYNIRQMVKKVREYTDSTELPILKECCFENGWDYDYFIYLQRENEILCRETRRLLAKKEIQLEKALIAGANNTGIIFSLKQIGWKDNPEPLVVNNTIQNNIGGNKSDKLKSVSKETLEALEEIFEEMECSENN